MAWQMGLQGMPACITAGTGLLALVSSVVPAPQHTAGFKLPKACAMCQGEAFSS